MTERKSRLDPDTKKRIISGLIGIIMSFALIAFVLIAATYFQREDIITDIEMAKNVTQTVSFNFTGGNP